MAAAGSGRAARARRRAQTGAIAATPSTTVAAGVETAFRLTLPAGCTGPVTVKGFPAPNGSTTSLQQVNSGTTAAPIVKLAGEWPPPSPDPKVFSLTITCANSKTGKENVTDESAPAPTDVVGVGSDTTENVFDQFNADYNATHKTSGTQLYGWDATNPITGVMGDTIVTKQTPSDDMTCSQPRPDGSSAGITALEDAKTLSGSPCIDFATSSRPRSGSDPATISFINLACIAVGIYKGGSEHTSIESWNGANWSVVPSPSRPGPELTRVSCGSAAACTGVGTQDINNLAASRTLIESGAASG